MKILRSEPLRGNTLVPYALEHSDRRFVSGRGDILRHVRHAARKIILNKNDELLKLLSFVHCRDKADVLRRASMIAHELISNWKIVSWAGARRFWGLEFYLHIPLIFEDTAPHKRTEQLRRGTFYFHTKSKGLWSPPIFNRHGVDITCGDSERKIYGGILLRHLGGVGHRDGSGLALRSLVRGDAGFSPIPRGIQSRWSENEILLFKGMNGTSVFGRELYLEHAPLAEKVRLQEVARIGIQETNYAQEKLGFRRVC